jgi:hypothetical protein
LGDGDESPDAAMAAPPPTRIARAAAAMRRAFRVRKRFMVGIEPDRSKRGLRTV